MLQCGNDERIKEKSIVLGFLDENIKKV